MFSAALALCLAQLLALTVAIAPVVASPDTRRSHQEKVEFATAEIQVDHVPVIRRKHKDAGDAELGGSRLVTDNHQRKYDVSVAEIHAVRMPVVRRSARTGTGAPGDTPADEPETTSVSGTVSSVTATSGTDGDGVSSPDSAGEADAISEEEEEAAEEGEEEEAAEEGEEKEKEEASEQEYGKLPPASPVGSSSDVLHPTSIPSEKLSNSGSASSDALHASTTAPWENPNWQRFPSNKKVAPDSAGVAFAPREEATVKEWNRPSIITLAIVFIVGGVSLSILFVIFDFKDRHGHWPWKPKPIRQAGPTEGSPAPSASPVLARADSDRDF